jgi:tetratricopeptide (TPR) repeat protein
LVAAPSAQAWDRSQLGAGLNNFAQLLLRRKKPAEAAKLFEEAVTTQIAALKADQKSPRFRLFLRNHFRNLTDARLALGDHVRAARAAMEPPRLYPYSWGEHLHAVRQLGRCVDLARNDGLPEAKRSELVRAYTLAARKHAREAVKGSGNDARALNTLAWFLAHSEFCRAPALVVELAQQAVELAPREGEPWGTLGAAHYRAGAWKESLKALEEAAKRRKVAEGQDMLYLALAHWRLDDKKEARQWYDKALKWLEKNKAKAPALRPLQREAALLGIDEKEK